MIKLKIKDNKNSGTPAVKQESPAADLKKKPKIKIKSSTSSSALNTTAKSGAGKPKIKFVNAKPPARIKLKAKRVPGDGYDTEDPEKEEKPLIEEAIILRMLPNDESLENLKYMLETGDMSKLSIKWKDTKRAVLRINGAMYGAKLVNLPTISEVSKTVDRKNIFKTVDVCQMLLVVKRLSDEKEISDIKVSEYETYTDGLTRPLMGVKDRYYKRYNNLVINKVEAKVEALLRADADAEASKYELVEMDQTPSTTTMNTPRGDYEYDYLSTTATPATTTGVDRESMVDEGEDDIGVDLDELGEEITDDLEAELAEALVGSGEEEEDGEEEEEEEEEEDDDDDEDDDDEDEGVRTKAMVEDNEQDLDHQHNEMIREEIAELEMTIQQKESDVAKATNPILRKRFLDIVNRLKQELVLKKQQVKAEDVDSKTGAGDDDDDDDDDDEDEDDEEEEEEEDEEEEAGQDEDDEEEDDGNTGLFAEAVQNERDHSNDEDDEEMEGLF